MVFSVVKSSISSFNLRSFVIPFGILANVLLPKFRDFSCVIFSTKSGNSFRPIPDKLSFSKFVSS